MASGPNRVAPVTKMKKARDYIKGSGCVINCVATFETRSQSLKNLHVSAARNLVKPQKKKE